MTVPSPRFYIELSFGHLSEANRYTLPPDVAHHAAKVLRLSVGTPIRLFDGRGGEYRAAIESIDRRGASARIDGFDPIDREWEGAPTLVQAVIAADPMDAAVRKAVELGVAAIQPVFAARSQRSQGSARGEKRVRHWRAIAIAACEQCGRNRIPQIEEPVDFDAWLRGAGPAAGPGAIAGPGATISLASYAARAMPRWVVVGPEGGFSAEEMALAVARGLVPVHLGPRVLRADTAATAALATLAAVGGDAR